MIKKALAIAGAGAILLSMAGPVFGTSGVGIFNMAFVSNRLYTKADSGDNMIGGFCVSGGAIQTGAASAYANVGNDVNSTLIGCPGCGGYIGVHNMAFVSNKVGTKADSGDNMIGGFVVSGGKITTGTAGASSVILNVVNFTDVGFPLP